MGFLAIDLSKALKLPLFDPNNKNARVADNAYPKAGNGLIGNNPEKPDAVVATNGGSDLIYVPGKDRKLTRKIVAALLEQDYVSGIFVDDELGNFPGTLPMSRIALNGSSRTPRPTIVVNFRSYVAGCDEPTVCSVEVADTVLRQGQGMHMGAILGGADRDTLGHLTAYAEAAGRAFQLADDLLDVTASPDAMGKATQKDADRNKQTLVSRLGVEAARRHLGDVVHDAITALTPFGPEATTLREAVRYFATREH